MQPSPIYSPMFNPSDRVPLTPDEIVQREFMRIQAWDIFAASILGMSLHPGTTRDKPRTMTAQEICALADEMLAERDRRWVRS